MQFAVAVAAYLNMQEQLKQVWSQPPGTGKTRTLVSLVYLLATLDQVPHITVRSWNNILLKQDQFALEEIRATVGGRTVISFRTANAHLGVKEDTIEVIDECDAIILDEDKFAEQHHNIGTLIGFTATPLKSTKHSSEKEYLSALGIKVYDSAIPPMGDPLEDVPAINWDQFFDQKRSKNARLVYVCRTDRLPPGCTKEELEAHGLTLTPFDPRSYRSLAPNTVTPICRNQ